MINLNSAGHRVGTPHTTESTKRHNSNNSISDALKRRAEAVIKNKSIDGETRAMIRYCLEMDDPWLAELVRRVDAGEAVVDATGLQMPGTGEDDLGNSDSNDDGSSEDRSSEERIEALAEIICEAGDQPAAALLVLMAMVEKSTHPKAVANVTKHFAFTRCGELNLYGMVDAQIELLARELIVG